MAVRPIDGNKLIEWFRPYLHTGEAIPADVVINDIRSIPTLTPPNEPLTLDELRQMDGEPVWVETIPSWLNGPKKCEWVIVSWNYDEVISTSRKTYLRADDYGDTWIAYRRPPEGEENT